jgi:uncharacterized membrane protein
VATLSVWKFETPGGAQQAEQALESLAKQELIQVHDAATVSWDPDKSKPKTRQAHSLAAAGALGGSLTDVGIDDDFIDSVRSKVTPGTSALFLLSSNAVPDRVVAALKEQDIHPELIQTNLSEDEEARLREAFDENA